MDKRRHRRLSTRLDVFFSIAQSGIHPGTLVDYGKGGVFVAFKNASQCATLEQQGVTSGRIIQLHLSLDDKDFLLDGVIAHLAVSGMGVKFVNVEALAFSALTEAARRAAQTTQNVVSMRERGRFDRGAFLKRCSDVCSEFFNEQIPEYFDEFSAFLLQSAEQHRGDVDQQSYFDGISLLKSVQKHFAVALGDRYHAAIASAILVDKDNANPDTKSNTVVSVRADRLKLVEKDDFEDWLVVKVAISRSELLLHEPLIELALRLEYACGLQGGIAENPFSPNVFFRGLHDELKGLQLHRNIVKLLYRNLVERMIGRFERLYKSINSLFILAGVLPDLNVAQYLAEKTTREKRGSENSIEIKSGSSGKSATPGTDEKSKQAKNAGGQNTQMLSDQHWINDELARDAFSTANRLLRLQRNGRSKNDTVVSLPHQANPAIDPVFVAESMSSDSVYKALGHVSRELAQTVDDAGSHSEVNLPVQVEQRLKQLNVPLSDDLKDSLYMMDSLVANIADEQKMTGDLRAQFCKMQVPLLALQIADPELFQSDQHPARDLLNYLALLAEPGSANFVANAETVKSVISRLMACDPLNEPAVVGVLHDVKKEVDRERRVIERNVQRVVESCDGKQRIKQANELLKVELNKRIADRPTPRLVIELVDAGWKELMRLSLLREGPQSRAYQTSLFILDDLLNLLGDRPVALDMLHFSKEDICKIVEKGLQKVAGPKINIVDMLSDISSAIDASDAEFVDGPPALVGEKGKSSDGTQELPKRWTKRVNRLKIGQWMEYAVKSDHKRLCQVAWISEDHDRITLVNQQGMRVADVSAQQMTEKLKEGDIVLLGDGSVTAVEKGLDALIQKIYEKLSFDSSHDQLTGLLARKEFERSLAQAVARARRDRQSYALVYVDVLQFKVINNICGYEGGDQFLQQIAEKIRSANIEKQIVGRIGGNEFALIFPVSNENTAYRMACQIKSVVESMKFYWGKDHYSVLTAVAVCTFDCASNHIFELLRTVESGVQFAKTSGHKEVQMVIPGDIRFERRDSIMSWVARINSALEKGNLRLRCQKIAPAIELHPDWSPHFEILLTIVDESGEHLPPAEFIRAAEEYGRMADVDRWVINQVLLWMKKNSEYMKGVGGFSINLSGHTLNDESFLDYVFEQFVRYDVPRDKIIFEITETTAVANLDEAADFINEMKEIGCRFSLDDFGAGQSSYAYLKKLPVDFIKIDGAFIKNIDQDKVDFALVKSITDMGHFLNKHIVAEFVSDRAKYNTVVSLGVDYIQGYHIAKPVMLDNLIESHPVHA